MTVAYITMQFPAGAETFACTDIRILREQGAEVSVHAMRRERRGSAQMLAERGLGGLAVTYASMAGLARALAFAVRHPRTTARWAARMVRATWRQPRFLPITCWLAPRALDIAWTLERQRPDVVHLFWGHYPSLVGTLLPELLPGTVRSMFLGAYDLTCGYGPSVEAAREADVVFTHARANVTELVARGVPDARIALVHRGIDVARFRASGPRIAHRVACAGRLCREKRMDEVLRVCAGARREVPTVSVTVMGNGPERAQLRRLDRRLGLGTRFLGHVPQAVVRNELAQADVFLHLSTEHTERLTNVVKEAMASGCICIVVRSPGIDELVQHGVDGFLVEPRDVAAAASRLTWALLHPAETKPMRLAAAARIRDAFDARVSMLAYRARWAEALVRRSTRSAGAPQVAWRPAPGVLTSKGEP